MSNYIPKTERLIVPGKRKPLTSIAALQWAADRAGKSYGSLTPDDEARIQLDYEDMLRQRKVELARWAQRADTALAADEFIITDENV